MLRILTRKNARRYCLRTQYRTKWYVYDLVAIPMIVLGLRNLNAYKPDNKPRWVLSWKNDANIHRAVELAFLFLQGWQAFRTSTPSRLKIQRLKQRLPALVVRFQHRMKEARVFCIAQAARLGGRDRAAIVRSMAEVVHSISKFKTEANPMLASKLLHFIFPEFFPVWDSYWIKNKCLRRLKRLGLYTLSPEMLEEVSHLNMAAREYATYLEFMLSDIRSGGAAKEIRGTFMRAGEFDNSAIDWHYHDITPTFFEMCLLGRFC